MIEEIQKVWSYFTPWSWEWILAKGLLVICLCILIYAFIYTSQDE